MVTLMMGRRIAVSIFICVLCALLGAVKAESDKATPKVNAKFFEPFNTNFTSRWVIASTPDNVEWAWSKPTQAIGDEDDYGLLLPAGRGALSVKFDNEVKITQTQPLVVQYEVKLQYGLHCGGAYMKLLTKEATKDLKAFGSSTPYAIMFGPDRCVPNEKVHFIFRHQNPKSGEWEEKHLIDPPPVKSDKKTHLYTLVVRGDNSFEISIDGKVVRSGNLLVDFDPPVAPSKLIDDKTDEMPKDWVEDEFIPDPNAQKPDEWDESAPREVPDHNAVKPEDWDELEPSLIRDPTVEQPEGWDEVEDGNWEAPMIPNPRCSRISGCGPWRAPLRPNPNFKGRWTPPRIRNPNFKGKWQPRKIENPHYFEDSTPALSLPPINGLGFELLTMHGGILFDNIIVGNDEKAAQDYADATWRPKFAKEVDPEAEQEEEADWLETLRTHSVKASVLFGFVVVGIFISLRHSASAAAQAARSPIEMRQDAKRTKGQKNQKVKGGATMGSDDSETDIEEETEESSSEDEKKEKPPAKPKQAPPQKGKEVREVKRRGNARRQE